MFDSQLPTCSYIALDVCEVTVRDRYTCNTENRALDVRSSSIYADRANLRCEASSQLRPAAGAVIYGQLFASLQLQGIAYIATSPRLFSKFPAYASSLLHASRSPRYNAWFVVENKVERMQSWCSDRCADVRRC